MVLLFWKEYRNVSQPCSDLSALDGRFWFVYGHFTKFEEEVLLYLYKNICSALLGSTAGNSDHCIPHKMQTLICWSLVSFFPIDYGTQE